MSTIATARAVRGEPFVLVTGKLAKDDGTVNVLAEKVEGLQLGGAQHAAPLQASSSPFLPQSHASRRTRLQGLGMTLGFRVKSGWAAAVLIAKSAKAHTVIDSRVITLQTLAWRTRANPTTPGSAQSRPTPPRSRAWCAHRAFSRRTIAACWMNTVLSIACTVTAVVVSSLTDPRHDCQSTHARARLRRSVIPHCARRRVGTVRRDSARRTRARGVRCARQGAAPFAEPGEEPGRGAGEGVGRWRPSRKVAAAAAWLIS